MQQELLISATETLSEIRPRRERIDKGQRRFTRRNIHALRWIGDQTTVRLDVLNHVFTHYAGRKELLHEQNLRKWVRQYQDLGLIEYHKILAAQPGFVWLSSEGKKEFGYSGRVVEPSLRDLKHYDFTSQVRLYLENLERYKGLLTWKAERRLKAERNNFDNEAQTELHIPDGEVVIKQGEIELTIAAEVEISQKSFPEIKKVVDKLRRQYKRIWYFVDDTTEDWVKKAVEDDQKFTLKHLKEVILNESDLHRYY